MTKPKLEESLQHLNRCAELERQLESLSDPYAIVEQALRFIPRIFEPLFTTKCSGEATGLGLSISKEIIERHGGRIEVDSSAGHGAVFSIYLPPLEDGPQELLKEWQ